MNRPAGNLSLLLRPTLPAPAKLPLRPRAPIQKPERRAFLFLQGPPGPLLHQLATAMRDRGMKVERINICAGDRIDWPEPATDFRGRFGDWPVFVHTQNHVAPAACVALDEWSGQAWPVLRP